MKCLKGTKTEKNLMRAFAGESQARNKYTFYAEIAKCQGYMEIAYIFEETANQEKAHARRFYQILNKYISGEEIHIEDVYRVGLYEETIQNLNEAYIAESFEADKLYPEFEKIAKEEGFKDIAEAFKEISEIEEWHSKRFKTLQDNIKHDSVFKKNKIVLWQCLNCGYIHEGYEAPKKCPACKYPRNYFKVLCERY